MTNKQAKITLTDLKEASADTEKIHFLDIQYTTLQPTSAIFCATTAL
ncbi:MAG: hypothetical protein RL138_779 [Bacteroidota bacterium]